MAKDLFISALLDVYGKFLGEKQRLIAEYYYNDDLSLGEIAENEGISRQGVRDFVKRAEQQLYRMENDCGYCKKFLRMKELSENLKQGDRAAAEEIAALIENL